LREEEKLTDATVEKIRGFAKMLEQSGYKVDVKSDSKIEGKSLYDGATLNILNKSVIK
jgi:hypothetical protein